MPHYGILREYSFEDINDVRGSEVYGVNDERLGTIEDVIFDHTTADIRYIRAEDRKSCFQKTDHCASQPH